MVLWPLHPTPTTISSTKHYAFHPICLLFPEMSPEEIQELATDIKAKGLLHPIILYEGKILDGRNRYLTCGIAGVEPRFVVTVHGDCPNFRGRDDVSPEIRLCRRENGTVPLGRKGTGTFFGLRASNVAQRLNRPKNEPVPGGL